MAKSDPDRFLIDILRIGVARQAAPQLGAVARAAREDVLVPGQARHAGPVALHVAQLFALVDVPQLHDRVRPADGEKVAVAEVKDEAELPHANVSDS